MRTAIISDIHGHWPGMEIVCQHIQSQNVDRIICLGDIVEGGEYDDFVVEFIRDQRIISVRGNHDEFNDCQLKPENQTWLITLPETRIENDILFTHISPRIIKSSIKDHIEAWNVFNDSNFRLLFIGHLHFPALFGDRNEDFGEACAYTVDAGEISLDITDRYIICFGAVGYARGGGNFIRYGIYDDVKNSVEFIKIEGELLPYG